MDAEAEYMDTEDQLQFYNKNLMKKIHRLLEEVKLSPNQIFHQTNSSAHL